MTEANHKKRKLSAWRLGEILIQNGWVTWEQLEKALEILQRQDVSNGNLPPPSSTMFHLGEILIRNGNISWIQLRDALEVQSETGRIIGEILLQKGAVTKKDLYRALALKFNKAYVDFDNITISSDVLRMIPKDIAYEQKIMPLVQKNGMLLVAISDVNNPVTVQILEKYLKFIEVRTAFAQPEAITKALHRYYGPL